MQLQCYQQTFNISVWTCRVVDIRSTIRCAKTVTSRAGKNRTKSSFFRGRRTRKKKFSAEFPAHLSTRVIHRRRRELSDVAVRSYRVIDSSPHLLSTCDTTTYGKLSYCALEGVFLGSRPFRRRRRTAPRKTATNPPCTWSLVLVRWSRLKQRRGQPSSRIPWTATGGMGSGRGSRTTTSCDVRPRTARPNGFVSRTTRRRTVRPKCA